MMDTCPHMHSPEPARAAFVDLADPISHQTYQAASILFAPSRWDDDPDNRTRDMHQLFGASFMVDSDSAGFAFLRFLHAACGGIGLTYKGVR